jgi:hypothetical protein
MIKTNKELIIYNWLEIQTNIFNNHEYVIVSMHGKAM